MEALQASALPLGYATDELEFIKESALNSQDVFNLVGILLYNVLTIKGLVVSLHNRLTSKLGEQFPFS